MTNARGTDSQIANDIGQKAIVYPPLGQIEPALIQQIQKELQAIFVAERPKDLAHAIYIGLGHNPLLRQLSK